MWIFENVFLIQTSILLLVICVLICLLGYILKRRNCKKCFYRASLDLRRYYSNFWNDDSQISDLILTALKIIKNTQEVYEVYYIQYNENSSIKLAASSYEVLNIEYENQNIFSIITPIELDVLKKCYKHKQKKQDKDQTKVFDLVNDKSAFFFPINIDGFNVGQICLVFDKKHCPKNPNDDVIHLVTGLLKYKEKSTILNDALGRCESDLETMLNATSHGVIILDMDLQIRRVNHIAENMIGLDNDECQGQNIEDITKIININDEVVKEIINESINKSSFICRRGRFSICSKLQKKYLIRLEAAPIFGMNGTQGVTLNFCDVGTEEIIESERNQHKEEIEKHYLELQMEQEQRREIEKALIKSGALASAGTLAASIAHEYNNVNAIAMGNLDVLLQMKDLPDFAVDSLKTIRSMMSRGSEITTELLDYTRNNHTNGNKRENVSLIEIAEKAKKMVDKEFAVEGIEFKSNLKKIKKSDEEKYIVFVDPSRIQQVILNIVLNARHAMIESDQKRVSFEIGIDNDHPYLKISDTGHGIPKEDLDKLFSPFFSTKGEYAKFQSQKQFKGNGLGLAICDLIMKKNGGSISASSETGKGTTFTLKFDEALPEFFNVEKHESQEEKDEVEIKNGKGKRILILDDEYELCKLLKKMFVSHGYAVEYSDDGYEGIRMHQKDPFDLVITDIQMPKMTGLEFLNKISSLGEPQPKKIIMTGRITKQEIKDTKIDGFIPKPFDIIEFITTIQRLLGL